MNYYKSKKQTEVPFGNHQVCPRCGERTCETLKSHSHCPNCNYFHYYPSDDGILGLEDKLLRSMFTQKKWPR